MMATALERIGASHAASRNFQRDGGASSCGTLNMLGVMNPVKPATNATTATAANTQAIAFSMLRPPSLYRAARSRCRRPWARDFSTFAGSAFGPQHRNTRPLVTVCTALRPCASAFSSSVARWAALNPANNICWRRSRAAPRCSTSSL